jgi:phosphoribosyl-ATP pyrophosphohydrolase
MKTFEQLFDELAEKIHTQDPHSGSVRLFNKGKHAIGKKIMEEAGETWMAAEHEGREQAAEEISQLIYHLQVMMLACGLKPEDIYRYL